MFGKVVSVGKDVSVGRGFVWEGVLYGEDSLCVKWFCVQRAVCEVSVGGVLVWEVCLCGRCVCVGRGVCVGMWGGGGGLCRGVGWLYSTAQ